MSARTSWRRVVTSWRMVAIARQRPRPTPMIATMMAMVSVFMKPILSRRGPWLQVLRVALLVIPPLLILPPPVLQHLFQGFQTKHLKACVFIQGKLSQLSVQIDRETEQHPLRHAWVGLAGTFNEELRWPARAAPCTASARLDLLFAKVRDSVDPFIQFVDLSRCLPLR